MRIAAILSILGAAIMTTTPANAADPDRPRGWNIVLPAEPHPAERYAAEELQSILARASGVKLPVVTEIDRPAHHVFVGPSEAMRESSAAMGVDDLDIEDVRIVCEPDNIAIAGGSPRGTLYAVYTYLEQYVGVRFLSPDHTYVPKIDEPVVIGHRELTYRPPLMYRRCYYGANRHHPAFAAKLRNNAVSDDEKIGGRTPWRLINHSVSRWVSVREFGDEHPEYFALVDGERRAWMDGDHFADGGTQPCMTHPAVKRLITEGVLDYLDKHPERINISVSQNDNRMYCRCEQCAAIDEREGTHMGALLTLVNEVADAVAEQHPGVQVGTLAYQYSRKPPKHMKPRDNVAIQLCSIECCVMHPIDDPDCEQNRAFCDDLAGWGKISDQVHVWNYNTNFRDYFCPVPNLRVIGPNVKYFVANNARGLFMQAAGGGKSTELQDLRNYVISRLMWDPALDGEALIDEFITLHYGEAAGPIRQYVALIHDNAAARGIHRHCFGAPADYGIDAALVERGTELFEQAMVSAKSDAVRRRVEKASLTMHRMACEPFYRWMRSNYQAFLAGDTAPPADLIASQREPVRRFFDLCEKYEGNLLAERTHFDKVRDRIAPLLETE